MKGKKSIFCAIIACTAAPVTIAAHPYAHLKTDYAKTFLFSLGGKDMPSLKITVPRGYRLLNPERMPPANQLFVEFVKDQDKNPHLWSEIISVQSVNLNGVTAEQFIFILKKRLQEHDPGSRVKESDWWFSGSNSIKGKRLTIAYRAPNGRREVMSCVYVSDRNGDIRGIQYALPQSGMESEERISQKIEAFIKANVSIVPAVYQK